jgi:indolepyruvate ferredoxin oxidoreductase alpha subunit
MCTDEAGKSRASGNMAFAVGCVRSGIHGADGYPHAHKEVFKGLSESRYVHVGWSVNRLLPW